MGVRGSNPQHLCLEKIDLSNLLRPRSQTLFLKYSKDNKTSNCADGKVQHSIDAVFDMSRQRVESRSWQQIRIELLILLFHSRKWHRCQEYIAEREMLVVMVQ